VVWKQLHRRIPLRKQSTKAKTRARAFAQAKRTASGFCQIRAPGCTGKAVTLHHAKLRSQGGDEAATNLVPVCRHCHEWAHSHPSAAAAQGWYRMRKGAA
jgi:hypothetical protein